MVDKTDKSHHVEDKEIQQGLKETRHDYTEPRHVDTKLDEEIRCDDEKIRHTGGCHCGAVRYEVYAPKVLRCFRCNCSICTKKQHILHAPVEYFKLLQGEDNLTTYTFNTHQAKHIFCKV